MVILCVCALLSTALVLGFMAQQRPDAVAYFLTAQGLAAGTAVLVGSAVYCMIWRYLGALLLGLAPAETSSTIASHGIPAAAALGVALALGLGVMRPQLGPPGLWLALAVAVLQWGVVQIL